MKDLIANQYAPTASRIAALLGLLGVGMGAFGAHAFKARLEEVGTVEQWKTAVLYHLVHAVVIYFLALRGAGAKAAWWCMVVGIALFSGSLYVYALSGIKVFAHITPFGGLALMLGWLVLALRRKAV